MGKMIERSPASFEKVLCRTTVDRAPRLPNRVSAILIGLLFFGVVCAAQDQSQPAQDQSLAKVAREKPARKAKVVITNDDLPSKPESSAEPAASSQGNSAVSAKDAPASPEQPKPESTVDGLPKVGTVDEARDLVERLKQQEQTLIRRYDEIQRKLADTNDASPRRVYSDALAKRDETLARTRQQIDEAERALRLATEAGKTQGDTTNAAK